jgi:hypothetical protein
LRREIQEKIEAAKLRAAAGIKPLRAKTKQKKKPRLVLVKPPKPVVEKPTTEQRFWSRVDRSAGDDACWPWIGAKTYRGYGAFWDGKKHSNGHRYSYELHSGVEIPDGMQIDHLCRVTYCVNPKHLELVTRKENMRRMGDAVTHCRMGHAYAPENTYKDKRGSRSCLICRRARSTAWWDSQKAA